MALFDPDRETEKTLIQKAERLQKERPQVTFSAAVLSAVGWYMCTPVLIGTLLGKYLDAHAAVTGFSWTLNGILLGFACGIAGVAWWIKKEGADLLQHTHQKEKDTKQQ